MIALSNDYTPVPDYHAIAARKTLQHLVSLARARGVRSMRQFAEAEIVVPDGPFAGLRYRCSRQPYSRAWFAGVDSHQWQRHVATGPSQTGKTLTCFVIPALYHLFELQETIIIGLPNMDIAEDKWAVDLLPAIEKSQYRRYLPRVGAGSRGGVGELIQFRHGPKLRFMTAGGGDKSRAHFTARVLIITETDGFDESGPRSREADKVSQMEARTRAFGPRALTYMECTLSTSKGRTNVEYEASTRGRWALPCPHCHEYVVPEREDLTGWRDAETVQDARAAAAFCCPACGDPWTEDQRHRANLAGVLLFGDQTADQSAVGPVVKGDVPRVDTNGLRWSAVHNMFADAGTVAADEWHAARAIDEDNAERKQCQFIWARPYDGIAAEDDVLDAPMIQARQARRPRGLVPEGTAYLTVGVDVHKYSCFYVVVAWKADATAHVVDYSLFEVHSSRLGVARALVAAFEEFRDLLLTGWAQHNGPPRVPDMVVVDSGYETDTVYGIVRAIAKHTARRFWILPSKGYGAGQDRTGVYRQPKARTSVVQRIGEQYHLSYLRDPGVFLLEVNADHWKTRVHGALSLPADSVGALTLFDVPPAEHLTYAKHLTAEEQKTEFHPRTGHTTRWVRKSRRNHYFDATYEAFVAAHYQGVRWVERPPVPIPQRQQAPQRFQTPDGRPFLVTERT